VCVLVCIYMRSTTFPTLHVFLCAQLCGNRRMYHILVTSGRTACIIHFHLGPCNRVREDVCVFVCMPAAVNKLFSWSECL